MHAITSPFRDYDFTYNEKLIRDLTAVLWPSKHHKWPGITRKTSFGSTPGERSGSLGWLYIFVSNWTKESMADYTEAKKPSSCHFAQRWWCAQGVTTPKTGHPPWRPWSKVDPCIGWIIGPVVRPGIGNSQCNQAWGTTYCLGSWRGSGMEHDIHLENFTEPHPTFSDLSGLESVTANLDVLHCPRFLPWSLSHPHLLARGPHLSLPTKPSPRGETLLRSCSPPAPIPSPVSAGSRHVWKPAGVMSWYNLGSKIWTFTTIPEMWPWLWLLQNWTSFARHCPRPSACCRRTADSNVVRNQSVGGPEYSQWRTPATPGGVHLQQQGHLQCPSLFRKQRRPEMPQHWRRYAEITGNVTIEGSHAAAARGRLDGQ